MDDKYERAVARWLAERHNKALEETGRVSGWWEPEKISDISFDFEEGYAYSEYTAESGYPTIEFRHNGVIEAVSLDGLPLGQFVGEVVSLLEGS